MAGQTEALASEFALPLRAVTRRYSHSVCQQACGDSTSANAASGDADDAGDDVGEAEAADVLTMDFENLDLSKEELKRKIFDDVRREG